MTQSDKKHRKNIFFGQDFHHSLFFPISPRGSSSESSSFLTNLQCVCTFVSVWKCQSLSIDNSVGRGSLSLHHYMSLFPIKMLCGMTPLSGEMRQVYTPNAPVRVSRKRVASELSLPPSTTLTSNSRSILSFFNSKLSFCRYKFILEGYRTECHCQS